MAQSMLPFQLAASEEVLTAQAGLVLFAEHLDRLHFLRWLERDMPQPGSGRGYSAVQQVLPLVLMLTGGGRSLEDLRVIHADPVLRRLLSWERLPSPDTVGDWLRRTGEGEGLAGLDRVHRRVVAAHLRKGGRKAHTLDIDATQIVAEKQEAAWTYKGERGYMPMVGHLAEAGVVIHDDFRAGNVAPATENLDFVKACETRLPQGHHITALRADSASYQAELFNYCERTDKTFAIGGRLDASTLAAIAALPDSAWTQYADCAVAETVHSMADTEKAFRLIVVRYRHQAELLEEDRPRYHVIASNRSGSTADVLVWYRQRGEHSENGIKELKIGFGMERMPCGQESANAAFFRIGVIAHNLFVHFKHAALGEDWQRHRVATVRWRWFQVPGRLIHHAGRWMLKIATHRLDEFLAIRSRADPDGSPLAT
ncbi:IS1380 family transposase [Acidithiobacillus sp. M4-SHS-6]|uniref:IS1380 family transposase n=1 Tax=Acidithiobacillus sp. M4-SHS-6 TaxID=3383024 RepID=UPI0039BEC77D